MYQEHKTKKKKMPARPDSLVNESESFFTKDFMEIVNADIV